MKVFIVGILIFIVILVLFVVYCCIVVGAQESRRLEKLCMEAAKGKSEADSEAVMKDKRNHD